MVYSVTFQPNLHQLSFTGLPKEVPRLSLHTIDHQIAFFMSLKTCIEKVRV